MHLLEAKLNELTEYYKCVLDIMRKEQERIGGGYISISSHHGRPYFYETNGKAKRSITRNRVRTYQLIRKKYLVLKIRETERILRQIYLLRKKLTNQKDFTLFPRTYIMQRFGNHCTNLESVFLTQFQRAHANQQSQNPYGRDDLKYRTNGGILVRSLSEQIIGNIYEEMGIPYQYEMRLTVDVTDMGDIPGARHHGGRWYKDYYPDFVIPLPDGSLIIHEHLGLIDGIDYRTKLGEKVTAYLNSGTVDPDRLLFTFPKDIRDNTRFRRLLRRKVMPYI